MSTKRQPARPGNGRPTELGRPLSPLDEAALRAYGRTASYKDSAASMGMPVTTFQRHIHRAYERLGVEHGIDAFRVKGWLVIPDE